MYKLGKEVDLTGNLERLLHRVVLCRSAGSIQINRSIVLLEAMKPYLDRGEYRNIGPNATVNFEYAPLSHPRLFIAGGTTHL